MKQEQEQLAIRVYTQMQAQWAQVTVPRAFQGPQPAQYLSHPDEHFSHPAQHFAHPVENFSHPVQHLAHPRAVRPPPQSHFRGHFQYPPPPFNVADRPQSAPVNVARPGFGNYPPSGPGFDPRSGFNRLSQRGFRHVPQPPSFHGVRQPGFHHGTRPGFRPGPLPQQVRHPGHHRKRPPQQQVPGSTSMHKSFSAPMPIDPALGTAVTSSKSTTAPTMSGQTAGGKSAAHNLNGQVHLGATRESKSGKRILPQHCHHLSYFALQFLVCVRLTSCIFLSVRLILVVDCTFLGL